MSGENTPGDTIETADLTSNETGSGSAGSSGSRISIKIPRKAVSGDETDKSGNDIIGKNSSIGKLYEIGEGEENENETEGSEAETKEIKEEKKERPRKTKPVRGRKRRGDDSDESAYSESDASEEESESEEVYSEDEDEEEGEGEGESDEDEYEDESEEEWDERSRKYVRKTANYGSTYRSHIPPVSIPFQYSGMGYTPIQPLPANMANIPMFAKIAQAQNNGSGQANGPPAPTDDAINEVTSPSTTTASAMQPKTVSTNQDSPTPNPSPTLTPAQLQELAKKTIASLAKNTIASLASAPPSGKILLPRNPDATVRPSTELKETLTSMLVSPQWRQALLAKLHMNKTISAEQASKLGLQPATAPMLPPMGMTQIPIVRPYIRPMTSMSMPHRPKPNKSKKRKKVSPISSIEDVPIAARRERRTPRKAVDYSKFFKEDIEEEDDVDDDEMKDDEEIDDKEDEFEAIQTKVIPSRTPKSKKIRGKNERRENKSDDDYDQYDDDDDDDGGIMTLRTSRSSDDFGVEKILSHRIVDGKNEFYVKFHNLSYVHADWIGEEEMLEESNGASRIKRFLSKSLSMRHYSDKHIFNPEYIQIDRIIHGWEHPDEKDPGLVTASYLVKWTGLPYCDATWEKKATIQSLPDGSDRLKDYEARPSLQQRQTMTAPLGYRPDKTIHINLVESPTYKGGNTLRPYQLEGLNWLTYCWINRQSCIIADEMGLGKTVQSVAFLDLIYKKFNIRGPFLIVAPLSTIPHWEREFEAWTNLNCIVYHGNIPSRDLMSEYEFHYKTLEDKPVPGYYKFDVLITTYEMALAGFEHLQPILWRTAVFDEAHRLKNRASKASETLKALQVEHKILLSGTPLQNNIEELWSLLNFLQPHRFFSESQFIAEYGNLQRSEDVIRLQEMLKPLMLRRLKEDVEKSIPVKEETVIEVELTAVQKRYYRAILERNFAFLTKGCVGTNAPNLINAMMELRKCCIHPYLIKGAEERILTECNAQTLEEQMQCMIQASGKLVLVDKLLRRLRENGHRVLIFSQMTRCLDLLVDYLRWREYPFERIDGAIRGDLRQAAIDRFCDLNMDSFVFLLCTRAGGVGINLTAADTVVIFDSDWNPQNDIQAQARCHRIGQTKSVKVYRLLTRNTYEREMFDKAGMKLGLDRAVLRKILPNETLEGAAHNPQLSKKEVETLLKKGAYGLLMENDEDAIKFCEEDIDQILARRTTIIRHEGGTQETAEGGSIFSKASFAATADDMDIDIDDPNFWELWARRLDLDPRQLLSSSGVVVDEPRIKRQARRLKQEDLSLGELEQKLEQDKSLLPGVEQVVGEPHKWTMAERALFISELLRFGIHRFDTMLSSFPNRSKNDLIACARAVIKYCLEVVDGSDDARLREDNEKLLLAHLDFDRSAMEAVDEVTGKIDLAAAEIQAEEPIEPTAPTSKEFSKAEIPFSGASRRQIIEYKSFLREAPVGLITSLKINAKGIMLRLQLLDFIRQLIESHATVAKKGKRGQEDSIEYQLPVPHIIGSSPTRGWGKIEDEALVVGIYRHGFGRYEAIRNDPNLIFSTMTWANSKPVDGKAAMDIGDSDQPYENPEWPDNSKLDDRLKKVVLAMEKRTQAAAKLAIQAMNATEGGRRRTTIVDDEDEMYEEEYVPEDGKRQVRGKGVPKSPAALSTRWSKRDRGEFQRVVMSFGLPLETSPGHREWSKFKELGAFANTIIRAGDRAFNEYCELFVKGCKAVADKRGKRGVKDDLGEDDGVMEELSSDGGFEKGSLPLIPVERARKALSRVELFDKLRLNIVTLKDLSSYLGRSRKTSGLPSWWETPDHDVALLKAVGKHGFGRWDLVIMDDELPFRKVYAEAQPEAFEGATISEPETPVRGRRRKLVMKGTPSGAQVDPTRIDWPAEATLTRRVESLVEMANNEERRRAEPSPKKRIKLTHGKGRKNRQKSLLDFASKRTDDDDDGKKQDLLTADFD